MSNYTVNILILSITACPLYTYLNSFQPLDQLQQLSHAQKLEIMKTLSRNTQYIQEHKTLSTKTIQKLYHSLFVENPDELNAHSTKEDYDYLWGQSKPLHPKTERNVYNRLKQYGLHTPENHILLSVLMRSPHPHAIARTGNIGPQSCMMQINEKWWNALKECEQHHVICHELFHFLNRHCENAVIKAFDKSIDALKIASNTLHQPCWANKLKIYYCMLSLALKHKKIPDSSTIRMLAQCAHLLPFFLQEGQKLDKTIEQNEAVAELSALDYLIAHGYYKRSELVANIVDAMSSMEKIASNPHLNDIEALYAYDLWMEKKEKLRLTTPKSIEEFHHENGHELNKFCNEYIVNRRTNMAKAIEHTKKYIKWVLTQIKADGPPEEKLIFQDLLEKLNNTHTQQSNQFFNN